MDTSVKTALASADQEIRKVEDPATKKALESLRSAIDALLAAAGAAAISHERMTAGIPAARRFTEAKLYVLRALPTLA